MIKSRFGSASVYVLAILLCVVCLACVMKLPNADLHVPFSYSTDGLFYQMLLKGVMDNGWYLTNSYLGAPGAQQMHDFPLDDSLHFEIMKLMSLACPDYSVVFNLYFLLTFPLVTLASLIVFRYFQISHAPAILGSLLFAFLPYHFQRGPEHLPYAAYYLIPLMVMVILWVFRSQVIWCWDEENGTGRWDLFSWRTLAALGISGLVSSAGFYYAFFACYFLLLGGVSSCFSRRKISALWPALVLVSVISLGALANLWPSLSYWQTHGRNPIVAARNMRESELFGLKIIQVVLPIINHRLPVFNKLAISYAAQTLSVDTQDYLGIIGCVGFLFLLGRLLLGSSQRKNSSHFDHLQVLTIAALLLATVSGFGTLFNLLVTPSLRCYYRITPYIGFFVIFAIVLLLDQLGKKWLTRWPTTLAFYGLTAILLPIGILDQTTKDHVRHYAALKREFQADARFVQSIEASVPRHAMIFQLPYKAFPENGYGLTHKLPDYELFRGYFHSKTLHWSHGAMNCREVNQWQEAVAQQTPSQLVQTLALAGFSGIYIDRLGYADAARGLEAQLTTVLGVQPTVNQNNRLSFYNLTAYRRMLRSQYSKEECDAKRNAALHPLKQTWDDGFLEEKVFAKRNGE